MSLPKVSLTEAGAGLGLGAAFGLLMGGPSSAGIGAMAGLAFAAANARKNETRPERPLTERRAQDRRRLFVRGLCSPKIDRVDALASAFRRGGALTAARALKQHAVDLMAVQSKEVDDATAARFAEIVTLAREQFHEDSPEVKAALANAEAADAARSPVP